MRVLMTTDSVGGVWQYSLALARGLVELHGCQVLLACLGKPPVADMGESICGDGLEVVPLDLRLEWMPDSGGDVVRGLEQVRGLIARWRPDVVHSNQFCFGLLDSAVPRVVVAHSDVLSWMAWHRGVLSSQQSAVSYQSSSLITHHSSLISPDGLDDDLRSYRQLVMDGLAGASAVVCPSHFMALSLEMVYGQQSIVIYNGLWPDLYPRRPKACAAVVAGRLWDESKKAATAIAAVEGLPLELLLVGPTAGPSGEGVFLPVAPNVRLLGRLDWAKTRDTIAGARFYLATSSYEPFGLAALEGAFCGCALLANDTPAYREIWGNAALYYRRDDASDLRRILTALLASPLQAERLAEAAQERAREKYTARRMAGEYYQLYGGLLGLQRRGNPAPTSWV